MSLDSLEAAIFTGGFQWNSCFQGSRNGNGHGSNPVPPVNIPIPSKIGSKMGGAPTPKWAPIGFDPRPNRGSPVTESGQGHRLRHKPVRAVAPATGPQRGKPGGWAKF